MERARKQGVPEAALIGQPRHAVRQIEASVDLLIAQGTEAGGHTGTIATMVLNPEIVDIATLRARCWPRVATSPAAKWLPPWLSSGRSLCGSVCCGCIAAARAGHEGALRLESFFVGQVVGFFERAQAWPTTSPARSSPTASGGSPSSPTSAPAKPDVTA